MYLHPGPWKPENSIIMCQHIHRTMSELYSFSAFTDQLPPGNNSLKLTLEKCVTVAVPNWFLLLDAQLLPQVNVRLYSMYMYQVPFVLEVCPGLPSSVLGIPSSYVFTRHCLLATPLSHPITFLGIPMAILDI